MRTLTTLLVALALGCSASPSWYVSHASSPAGGQERHSCKGGGTCAEGWACTAQGACEWCGDGDRTRCTEGND